jgi:hypothetical protein
MQGTERRIYQLHGAMLEMLRQRMVAGGLQMAPTIVIRIWLLFATGARPRAAPAAGCRRHAYRSRRRRRRRLAGFDNFEQCRYLNETPLPLPWDQLITVVLIVWQVTVPVVTVASTINEPLGCVLSVTIVWMLWALNEVARDVEDPFYNEPNDM